MANRLIGFYIVVVATTLSASICCLVLVLRHQSRITKESQSKSPETSQVCVTCNLLPDGPESHVLARRTQDGQDKFCALDIDQLSVLMELISRKQHVVPGSSLELTEIDNNLVSAHKQLEIGKKLFKSTELSNDTNAYLELNTDDKDHQWQHTSNVGVLPTGYQILVSGFYHIYSSIDLRAYNGRPCREYGLKTWRQVVVRSRVNERHASGVLLSSAHTCCDDCVRDKETSYTGGTFLLQAGDHLHMEVSDLRLVNFASDSSFFGLMLLADSGLAR